MPASFVDAPDGCGPFRAVFDEREVAGADDAYDRTALEPRAGHAAIRDEMRLRCVHPSPRRANQCEKVGPSCAKLPRLFGLPPACQTTRPLVSLSMRWTARMRPLIGLPNRRARWAAIDQRRRQELSRLPVAAAYPVTHRRQPDGFSTTTMIIDIAPRCRHRVQSRASCSTDRNELNKAPKFDGRGSMRRRCRCAPASLLRSAVLAQLEGGLQH